MCDYEPVLTPPAVFEGKVQLRKEKKMKSEKMTRKEIKTEKVVCGKIEVIKNPARMTSENKFHIVVSDYQLFFHTD